MDPVLKLYMYEHWLKDNEDKFEFAQSQSILIGSFYNPEAAQQMLQDKNPDIKAESSVDDFEETLKFVENQVPLKPKRRRIL